MAATIVVRCERLSRRIKTSGHIGMVVFGRLKTVRTVCERLEQGMKLRNEIEVDAFQKAVDACGGDVWLVGSDGSRFNLKSFISWYVALAALIRNYNNDLELFCDVKADEANFFRFFQENPRVLGGERNEFWQDV